MNHRRHGRLAFLIFGSLWAETAGAQDPPPPPRSDLPFAVEPDRLPGPPRAMGELPIGLTQPPSTLPGRMFGEPLRAMGEAPDFPLRQEPNPPGPTGLIPFPGFPQSGPMMDSNRTNSPIPFAFPGLARPGQGARASDLPLPLPEGLGGIAEPGEDTRPVGPPLRLEDVLYGAERSEPRFLAAMLDRDLATGDLISAQGAFDLNLNADSRNYPLGYYTRSVHDVFLEQPLQASGAKLFGGYRNGYGNYPSYYQYLQTRGGGAFVAGLELPLLKNGAIDAKRAKLRQTEIERRKAEPTVLKARAELFKNAAKAYWFWVAAGQTRFLYDDLARLAERRAQGLQEQIRAGAGRPIDEADFNRVVLYRRQQAINADRRFQQATIELALYLRDASGFPFWPRPPACLAPSRR